MACAQFALQSTVEAERKKLDFGLSAPGCLQGSVMLRRGCLIMGKQFVKSLSRVVQRIGR